MKKKFEPNPITDVASPDSVKTVKDAFDDNVKIISPRSPEANPA